MNLRSLPRLLALAAIALAPAATAAPAFAADSFLQSYAGNYTGTGTAPGTPPQQVRCRLTLTASSASKLVYTGRCGGSGPSFSMTGVITDDNGHITAAMQSEGGMSGTAVGVRRGDGVVFNSSGHNTDMGHNWDISSTLALTNHTLRIDYRIKDNKTGKTMAGAIPFTKS